MIKYVEVLAGANNTLTQTSTGSLVEIVLSFGERDTEQVVGKEQQPWIARHVSMFLLGGILVHLHPLSLENK